MLETIPKDIDCPYCGEVINILIDPADPSTEYVEDCQVCCRPITVRVSLNSAMSPEDPDAVSVNTVMEDEY